MKNIVSKIEALVAKANATDSHESDAYMAKALSLLEEYGMSMSDLSTDVKREWGFTESGPLSVGLTTHQLVLFGKLAEYYHCSYFMESANKRGRAGGKKRYVVLVGRPEAVQVAEIMIGYVWAQVINNAKILNHVYYGQGQKEGNQKPGWAHPRQVEMVSVALTHRVAHALAERAAEQNEAPETTALVLTEGLNEYMREQHNLISESVNGTMRTSGVAREIAAEINIDQMALED